MNILGTGIDAINFEALNISKIESDVNIIKNIQIDLIDIGNYQPRKKNAITVESIQDLIDSIKEHGILQPVILRCTDTERYELIAGERRLRAALELRLDEIPAVLKNIDAKQAYAIAIIENIQREQLSLLEEAEALLKLKNDYFMSVETVAKMIGKPRTTIANLIRVATHLSSFGKELLERGDVDYGHIRSVLILEEDIQNLVLNYVAEKKLTVRAAENFVREHGYDKLLTPNNCEKKESNSLDDESINLMARTLSDKYKTNVSLKRLSGGKIRVSMDFIDLEKVDKILGQ